MRDASISGGRAAWPPIRRLSRRGSARPQYMTLRLLPRPSPRRSVACPALGDARARTRPATSPSHRPVQRPTRSTAAGRSGASVATPTASMRLDCCAHRVASTRLTRSSHGRHRSSRWRHRRAGGRAGCVAAWAPSSVRRDETHAYDAGYTGTRRRAERGPSAGCRSRRQHAVRQRHVAGSCSSTLVPLMREHRRSRSAHHPCTGDLYE